MWFLVKPIRIRVDSTQKFSQKLHLIQYKLKFNSIFELNQLEFLLLQLQNTLLIQIFEKGNWTYFELALIFSFSHCASHTCLATIYYAYQLPMKMKQSNNTFHTNYIFYNIQFAYMYIAHIQEHTIYLYCFDYIILNYFHSFCRWLNAYVYINSSIFNRALLF